jgi:hypothetical protein
MEAWMTTEKLALAKEIVFSADRYVLKSAKSRKQFAKFLASSCNLWEPNTIEFVEEMRGLSFTLPEDRQSFVDFLDKAF